MTDLPASTAPAAAAHPLVKGRCPACNGTSLFLGSGGHVTCSRLDCPDPTLADDHLHGEQAEDDRKEWEATAYRHAQHWRNAEAALTRVRALHARVLRMEALVCAHCGHAWPCATIRALDETGPHAPADCPNPIPVPALSPYHGGSNRCACAQTKEN